MVFGPLWNPVYGTYPLECSLDVVTCPSISAVISHIPWVIPTLLAVARRSTLPRAGQFCRNLTLERLRMGANRKDLFYYLVSSHIVMLAPSFHRM